MEKSPDEYRDGPRCPDCGSRDVEIEREESPPESVAATAFRRFREGNGPLDLVESGVCEPARAADLREAFNDLAGDEYHLLTEEELAERVDAAREEVEEEAQRQIRRERRRARQQVEAAKQEVAQVRQRLPQEFEAGWDRGEEKAREEFSERLEAMHEEVRAGYEERVAEIEDELQETVEAAEERGREEGRRTAVEAARRAGWREAVLSREASDFAAAYVEGFEHGVLVGAREGRDAGKSEGISLVAEMLAS